MARFCWFLLILVFAAHSLAFAQCPENIGFEGGNLNKWETYAGNISPTGVISVSPTPPLPDKHTLTRASDNARDYYGDFPTVSPNGSKYSVKLGNDGVGREVDRLSYTFTVPQTQLYSLVLNYAVVLQNSNHREFEQPRFTVTVFNITDNEYVQCPAFNFVASATLPGFKKSSVPPGGFSQADVYYKDWSATTINLSSYSGKQIRLEFTTNDCTPGGDFGYAYFDINEECNEVITGNTYCEGQNTVNLVGPKGFQNYTWYNVDQTQELGNEQILKVSPAPADGTQYVLVISTIPGLGCPDVITTTIRKSLTPFSFILKDNVLQFCNGGSVDLTAASVTEGSSPGLAFKYYKDPITLEYLRNPEKVTQAGTYYIEASNSEGCLNMLSVEVKIFDAAAVTVTDPQPVQYPATVNLASTFPKSIGYNYSYYSDEKATKPIADYMNVGTSGRYYVKAISNYGCEVIAPINVVVTPPDTYATNIPTAFTPNGDGTNDTFDIKVNGFLTVNSLTIFSRNGQLVFKTNNINNKWDGRFNGKYVPAGTYYWLLEGTDQYDNTSITKSGYVSVIK